MDRWAKLRPAVLLLLSTCHFAMTLDCGGYNTGIAAGTSFVVSSPHYPSHYDRNTNCVWLFEANMYTELRVNVSFMQLETNTNGSCKDYVLVTEGSATATELGKLCTSSSTAYISTLSRYLWIQFRSDHQVQDKGFILTVSAAYNQWANLTDSPVKACHLTQVQCPNKQCVETGYLCDSFNDCGCEDYGCDETKCWKFDLLNYAGFNWGFGVGAGVFIGLVLLVAFGLHEMPQHRRPECLRRGGYAGGSQIGGEASSESHCLLACTQRCRRNKVDQRQAGDQFKSMLERMSANRHPLRWETESESDIQSRGGGSSRLMSPRTSISGQSSRRSSYQLSASGASGYGNTLSPKDLPPRPPAAPGPAAAAQSATLTVPGTSAI